MLCDKLCLSIIENKCAAPIQQLCPIDPVSLIPSPFTVTKPSWCVIPTSSVKFQEVGSGLSYEIGRDAYHIVGRNEKSSIVLEDLMVSRCHALILHSHDCQTYLVDLGSAHGTYIGNYKLPQYTPTMINRYSVIRFGSSKKQYILRKYPRMDDILQISEEIDDDERTVIYNTFFNLNLFDSGRSCFLFPQVSIDSIISGSEHDSVKSVEDDTSSMRSASASDTTNETVMDDFEIMPRSTFHRCETVDFADPMTCQQYGSSIMDLSTKKRDCMGSLVMHPQMCTQEHSTRAKKKVSFYATNEYILEQCNDSCSSLEMNGDCV